MVDYLNVGKIVNTQGIKGEVRVISQTDFPELRYQKGATLYLFKDQQAPISLVVRSHRKHKNFDILSFEGHPSINDVEKYRDGQLKVPKEAAADLAPNEFYYHEIIGLTVEDEKGQDIGTVKEILSPGANDVWVVQRPHKKDLLLPYIASVVRLVDLAAGKVVVDIPEGLVDDEN